jgi:hypothetical protein
VNNEDESGSQSPMKEDALQRSSAQLPNNNDIFHSLEKIPLDNESYSPEDKKKTPGQFYEDHSPMNVSSTALGSSGTHQQPESSSTATKKSSHSIITQSSQNSVKKTSTTMGEESANVGK